MDNELSIGIDLGTTFCCVGVYINGKVDIIPNELGCRTTPSIVSFTTNERLIGESAKKQMTRNYNNTIYDFKNFIGRNYDDPEFQNNMKFWPFKVIKDTISNKPLIQVNYLRIKKTFYPEEILSMLISKMKNISEDYLGYKVSNAVITVPAYFNDSQRQATIDAAKIAGLNVLQIIDEPIAAAIAYGLDNENNEEKYILVFDLGGGTCDVSILYLNNSLFKMISTVNDNHLGGQDFDNRLLEYCIKEFKNETGIDISKNQKAIRRLKLVCEYAKMYLSSNHEYLIDIDALAEGEDFSITIKRPEFEDLCKDYFNKCIKIVERALNDSKLSKNEIDEIILTGGSSRIPIIQEMLKNYFGKELNKSIHPDEAVAYGAAIQAAKINNNDNDDIERLVLLDVIDVIPLSLGNELVNGKMDFIIKRNTIIPIKYTQRYKTTKDNQNKIKLRVYQGERLIANKNKFLGECIIENIPKKLKGKVKIDVTFEVDINCIIHVTAKLIDSNQNNNIDIQMINNLSDYEIEKLIEEGKKMEENDLKNLTRKSINYENNDLIDIEENILNLSLGIELMNGEMKKIIPRNSKIPFKNSFLYNAKVNDDNEILLKFYQGERILAIGNFLLKKIKLSSKEKIQFIELEIIFELDVNLILIVKCKNISSGEIISNIEIQINNEFEEEYIEEKLENSINMENSDKIKIKQNNLKFEIEQYALKMIEKGNEALKWIKNHQKENIQVYTQILEDLKQI